MSRKADKMDGQEPKERPNTGNMGKGRPKGAANKMTRELKEMILDALDGAGGVEYLQERARDPRTASAFLGLVGKVLPMTIAGTGKDGAIIIQASALDERI
jgi:hypothetical protein